MAQELKQTTTQAAVQVQGHRLTQQQMLQVRLLEMPLTELEENVSAEIYDNPALEVGREHEEDDSSASTDAAESFEEQQEREERQDALDSALERIGGEDNDLPVYDPRSQPTDTADYEGMVYGDPVSFVDKLMEQMGERELTSRQQEILEYLIGSLDDDGLLRISLDSIADKLSIYQGLDVEEKRWSRCCWSCRISIHLVLARVAFRSAFCSKCIASNVLSVPSIPRRKRPWHSSITSSIPSYRMTGTPSPRSGGTSFSSS